MSDRLHELDQTQAVFTAMSSFWWRVLLFFGCCLFGHYVGLNCASAGELFRDVWSTGPSAFFHDDDLNPIFVPITWMWTLLIGCENPLGVLQLFVLGAGFLFVWLSEDRFIHGFALALLSQSIHTFLVTTAISRGDFIIGLVVLVSWVLTAGLAYWWCLRQME